VVAIAKSKQIFLRIPPKFPDCILGVRMVALSCDWGENDPDPESLANISWPTIKARISAAVASLV
jgi:hypothetical protein